MEFTPPKGMTPEQEETLEMLHSSFDVKNCDFMPETPERPYAVVFEGDGVDGPCCGYIETDGKVTWIAGG